MTKSQRITKHIENVRAFFPNAKSESGMLNLATRLRTLEKQAHHSAERYCNDSEYNSEFHAKIVERILRDLKELLGWQPGDPRVFVNGDPRGHALKIDCGDVRKMYDEKKIDIERDWGGYGILWPDFD